MNFMHTIKKLSEDLKDFDLKKKAEKMHDGIGKTLIVDISEIESIFFNNKKMESVDLEEVSVETK